jgi:hypothetical protein
MQAQAAKFRKADAADVAALSAIAAIASLAAAPVVEHHGCGWFDSSYELGTGLVVTEQQDSVLFELWSQILGGLSLH